MSYLNDVFFADPNKAKLYKVTNDALVTAGYPLETAKTPRAICVDMNMIGVWVVNTSEGTVSQFQSGVRVRDIAVGKNPMGICQALDGSIWVTNFTSNTVSRIDPTTKKVTTVNVGTGPRGICGDSDGNIWVANYIDSTVSKITNGIKVLDIKVGLSPYGICCDKDNSVWVACASANMVSKIVKDVKVMDIKVGKVPYGICCDKNGAIWVSNFYSGTVSKIVGSAVLKEIYTGDGAFAIASNADGAVYVMNTNAGTISKIAGDVKIADIQACDNPAGFGDFTGYQAYYMFKYSSGGGGTNKINLSDLSDDLKALIEKSSGVTLPIDDLQVTHADPDFPDVKTALNYLLYKAPVINSFTNDVNQVEIGSKVTALTLNWAFNKKIVKATIDNGVGDVSTVFTKALTGLALTADTTFTLSATDEKPTTVSKSTTVRFLNKVYYGESANTSLANADVLALGNNLATGTTMSHTYNCSGGKYMYIVMPSSFGLTTAKFSVGGLANSDWSKTTISFTNASGYTSNYDIFRSNNLQNGSSIKVDIA